MSNKYKGEPLDDDVQELLEEVKEVLRTGSVYESYSIFSDAFYNRDSLPNGTMMCWKLLKLMDEDLTDQQNADIEPPFDDCFYIAKSSFECFSKFIIFDWQWKIFKHSIDAAFHSASNEKEADKVKKLYWDLYRRLGEKGLKQALRHGDVMNIKRLFL